MAWLAIVSAALAVALVVIGVKLRDARRAEFIRHYAFPKGLIDKLQQRRPGLPAKDGQLVARALRHFFLAHLQSGRQFVAMPSQVADDLWHEFILYTRHYELFCQRAFGRFMHHTPAIALGAAQHDNAGLRRTWWQCCREENINPRKPTRLPLLFALDTKLGIEGGFHYEPDCAALRAGGDGSVYCGGDFAGGSGGGAGGGGGNDGFSFGSDASDGGGGADGGGDGGGGCGGGGGD